MLPVVTTGIGPSVTSYTRVPLTGTTDMTNEMCASSSLVAIEVQHVTLMMSDELIARHVGERVFGTILLAVTKRYEEIVMILRVRDP